MGGGYDGGMEVHKLINRMEDENWNPPILRFMIERHGATVMGSVYAEMQCWSVDVEKGLAKLETTKRRLVGSKRKPLKVEPIANEISDLVSTGKDDRRLKWYGKERVRVLIAEVLPEDFSLAKQTLAGRRRRLRDKIEKALSAHGWSKVSHTAPHTYEKRDG